LIARRTRIRSFRRGQRQRRSLPTEEYAKSIAASGGIGIANQIQHQLISLQEKRK
jgi:Rod binding domain-containing protein